MGLLAFLRVGVWMNGLQAFKRGFMGNILGEGFVLGGVFVIGQGQQVKPPSVKLCLNTPQNTLLLYMGKDMSKKHTWNCIMMFFVPFLPQGILLEHREIEFGDKVNAEDVIRAVRRIAQELQPFESK